ncbi:MAG: hypothetical protein IT450_23995 [Phycisphaerales bacterium]|nr:hypothetical protein [Phycisphaerales bacterium]
MSEEKLAALEAENQKLREELLVLKAAAAGTGAADATAESGGAEGGADLKALWHYLHVEIPEIFVETHTPTQKTFEQICEAFVELLRSFVTLEMHVQHMLRELRQVGEQNDKLNHFHMMLTKNPGLVDTLRDFLISGKRITNFANLVRAHQVWSRAFASGLQKVLVRSPNVISDEYNPKNWEVERSGFESEDAAIGKSLKKNLKLIADKIGTVFRKQASDGAYEDYNDLMRRR